MTAKNAHRVANILMLTAGGALAVLAWRQPAVRRAALRAMPLMLGGTPPLQVAAFVVARAMADQRKGQQSPPPRALGYATERGTADPVGVAAARRPTTLA
jgi:hypothetical protein